MIRWSAAAERCRLFVGGVSAAVAAAASGRVCSVQHTAAALSGNTQRCLCLSCGMFWILQQAAGHSVTT
jgi:hypothetical protein